jgi:poly(A) polymerase/tRNA nucleotidyltransferase (CCA-adding enzyme)
MVNKIPKYILEIISKLEENGFEAFVVGGSVRDLLLENPPAGGPKDWDIVTSAKPEEIMAVFPDSVYENDFGTVGVKIRSQKSEVSEQKITNIIEITTYRIESKYSDKRHPDEIKFAKTLAEDLSRRDFTVNTMALKLVGDGYEVIDSFGGREDLKNKIIRAVGDANERFSEDALRMIRAIRFSVQLGFSIEPETFRAISKNAKNLKYVSMERIKDEFEKIILSSRPADGIELLRRSGLLFEFIPEFQESVGVEQGFHHFDGPYRMVWDHLVASLRECPSEKLEVRLASLFHDIGKPRTRGGSGKTTTFYNHQYAGARITREIMNRLRFSRAVADKTVMLVRNHMFYYDVDQVGESGVRRVVRNVGRENINDLIDVRIADRLGSGVAKAVPYKLRHFKFMVDKVSHDPISVKQLKINGNDLMQDLSLSPGPKIGAILDVLLAKVIDDPRLNVREKLLELSEELIKEDLERLREMAKEKIEEEREVEDKKLKSKYFVK